MACLGVDTLSTDRGLSTTFAAHVLLAEADGYGLENLAGLGRLPASGARITVGLIPLEEGSGGPHALSRAGEPGQVMARGSTPYWHRTRTGAITLVSRWIT